MSELTSEPLRWLQGRFCSRCSFGSGCQGCVIANCELTFDLKPGDHVTITFLDLPENIIKEVGVAWLHVIPSTGALR